MGMEMEITKESIGDNQAVSSGRQAIVQALSEASKGELANYDKLLSELRDIHVEDPTSDNLLQMRLKALSQAVSFIRERDHELLLTHILGMSLWVHSLEVADALTEFSINLATVNGGCVAQCLDMLVRNFLPPSCGLPIFLDTFSRRALMKGMPKEALLNQKSLHLERKEAVLQRVHFAIGRIAELVPMTALHLQPIVLQRMPHRIVDKQWNALYLENMLRLDRSSSGNQMLMAVVDRLIEIDVEIRWEDIVREEDSNKVFVFDMDLDEMSEENETGLIGLGTEASALNGEIKQTLCAVADKMDVLMDMTLQHLQTCYSAGRTEQVFNCLMSSFQSTILDTYKSKFTQFLIFYVCSLAPTTCGHKFSMLLCDILASTHRAPTTRMSAAAYLASFLARAKYLPLSVITSSLKRVVDWCINFTPRHNDKRGASIADTGVNSVFYSACQAVMYVLCFRMKKLMEDPEHCVTLRNLHIEQILKHSMNPLKLCLPSVVGEFLKQATSLHLVNISVSDEINRTIETESAKSFGGVDRLDMFFPFDPYLLKHSDRFIRPNFTFWSMVQSEWEEQSSDDDDDESGLDDDFEPEDASGGPLTKHVHRTQAECAEEVDGDDQDMDEFERSMNRMSITPNDIEKSYLRSSNLPTKVLPLPSKLTAESLRHYTRALV